MRAEEQLRLGLQRILDLAGERAHVAMEKATWPAQTHCNSPSIDIRRRAATGIFNPPTNGPDPEPSPAK